ncbi:MAG: hypothetical protein RBT40_13775 [Petrimonas sp.]|jgi:uncharacterized protein YjcR|nr:hypothetical protein [Petrimonas sp.]
MKVAELLKDFKDAKHPAVAAASFIGISPNTISFWKNKDGLVPVQWAALYREKKAKEKK